MEFLKGSLKFLKGSFEIWDRIAPHVGYIKDLNDNVTILMKETDKLKRKREEVEDKVRDAELVGKRRRCNVGVWLQDVDPIVPEVESIQLESERGTANPISRYRLGKRVVENIEVVKALQDKGDFVEVAESPRRPLMTEFPVPSQLEKQSTSQETLQEIEEALYDEEIGVVCVSGMGGIGKTTLMKKIYNRLVGTRDFDVVIWATVSQDLNLNAIQQKIGNELGVEFGDNEGMEERRNRIYARLRNVKYMLILDDLWEAFSLDQGGIPRPDMKNGCKIAITTRLIAVTRAMEAHNEIRAKTIRMKTLTSEEAWDLFCSKTGDTVLLPRIKPVAQAVVKECGGLPLAIKTVGAAMRGKEEESLWENALRSLKGSAPEVRGMERQVFLPLKLSYDSLEDSSTKFCFLYCALFPEDYQIFMDSLVRYWVFEEGWIDKFDRVEEAINKGHDILDRLKDTCLLESVGEKYVKMHDLLRDLAIWITSQSSSPSSKFLVKSGLGLRDPPEEKNWEGVGRISLMSNHIQDLQIIPKSPDLVSLFLHNNRGLLAIHSGFFQLMPQLRILDLSWTGIRSLPPSLSHLVNLRALILISCGDLIEMPPLGELKELQHLDFTRTGIRELPEGIAKLVKLKQLNMSFTKLDRIPCNFISALTCLEHLRLHMAKEIGVATWREVTSLPRLVCLDMTVTDLNGFTAQDIGFLGSFSNLKSFLIQLGSTIFLSDTEKELNIDGDLKLQGCNLASFSQLLGRSKTLRKVSIVGCQGVKCIMDWREETEDANALDCLELLYLHRLLDLENIFHGESPLPPTRFQRLQKVTITNCPKLGCVFSSSMVGHLHQLEFLLVEDCEGVEEIVEGDILPDNPLQRLKYLSLYNLPKLRSICRLLPVLKSLEKIYVGFCPELKKLPPLRSAMQRIQGWVKGPREWWEGMEWGDDDRFKSIYYTIYTEKKPEDEEDKHTNETSETEEEGESMEETSETEEEGKSMEETSETEEEGESMEETSEMEEEGESMEETSETEGEGEEDAVEPEQSLCGQRGVVNFFLVLLLHLQKLVQAV